MNRQTNQFGRPTTCVTVHFTTEFSHRVHIEIYLGRKSVNSKWSKDNRKKKKRKMSKWCRQKELQELHELQEDNDVVDNVPKKLPKFMERRMVRPLADSNHSHCICERPMSRLLCTNCKKIYFGRISRTCTEHPNVIANWIFGTSRSSTYNHFSSLCVIGSLLARYEVVLQLQHENAHRNRRGNPNLHESNESLNDCGVAWISNQNQNHIYKCIRIVFSLNITFKMYRQWRFSCICCCY